MIVVLDIGPFYLSHSLDIDLAKLYGIISNNSYMFDRWLGIVLQYHLRAVKEFL
jgi:hypothetical protein